MLNHIVYEETGSVELHNLYIVCICHLINYDTNAV